MATVETNSIAPAAQPVGVTASDADLNATSALRTCTVVAANAGANTIDVTITVKDPDGATVAAPTQILVWLSDLSTGVGGSAHTHSTGPAFTVGEIQGVLIAADCWIVLTHTDGTAVLRLVDTANENVTINAQVLGGPGTRVADTTIAGDWSA